MGIQYSYTRVPLSGILAGLDHLFSGLELSPGVRITRSSNSNLLVLVSSTDRFREIDDFIDSVALIHPCRFFVIAVDEELREIYAEISARCHGLSAREQVCSEIVRISLPSPRLPALPELVRANLVPGTTSEVFLWDRSVPGPLIEQGTHVADRVFFDSGQSPDFLALGDRLLASAVKPVDLEWIGLVAWREHLKNLADLPEIRKRLPELSEVRLVAEAPQQLQRLPACLMLMAGWVTSRLKLEVIAWEDTHFTTISEKQQRVRLTLHASPGGSEARLTGMTLLFGDERGPVVTQLSGQHLETLDEKAHSGMVRRVVESENLIGKFRSYFQFGYAASHYLEALRVALELASLQQERHLD